ncbi:MAG TPA: transglutaminaseTgpA domain-containing protein [Candidatus Limnocylindrales bacterium]
MSAIQTSRVQRRPWTDAPAQEDERELPLAPREGWLTLIALIVMVGAVAVAIDDAVWAGLAPGSHESQTKFLPVAALLSVLIGAWLAKRPVRPIVAHLVGALGGGVFLLYAISGSISRSTSIVGRLHDLNLSVSNFVQQVFVLDTRSTETSVFLLIMGALVWGAGYFAAFNVFRRHQAAPGIVLAGVLLLINVSVTTTEEYIHLIVFVLAAMLLVMRLNLFEQMGEWRSRGMRELGDISGSFLRNGAVMVALVIGASVFLAANASSAPLSHAWNNIDDQLLEVGYDVNRWLGGVSGSARGPNILFTPTQTIRDFWESSTDPVFTATTSDGKGYRWRGAVYDSFDGTQWQQLDSQPSLVPAGQPLLAASAETVGVGPGWKAVSATITPADFGGNVFVSPAEAVAVDQPSELVTNGAGGPFVSAKLSNGIEANVPYTVQANVLQTSGPTAPTENEMAAAGVNYPSWIARYLDIRPGSVGDLVQQTAQKIYDGLPPTQRDPYHIAVAVQDYLYARGGFSYETDLRGLCGATQKVDCFLTIKKGYCEYFASAMVMLLRELNVPARYVVGYLPGIVQDNGSYLVERSASHAWVEVYFPNHGWLEFDPTPGNGGNGQAPTHLIEGAPVVVGSPGVATPPPAAQDPECIERVTRACLQSPPPVLTAQAPTPGGPDYPLFAVLIAVLAMGGVLMGATWLIRRVPSSEPEIAYSSLSRLASRLGYGPKPSQTVYEYADHLGQLVPVASGDLHLIATAKVESTYARRAPEQGTLAMIGMAYRHVRIGLLKLLVRKPRGFGSRQSRGGPPPV